MILPNRRATELHVDAEVTMKSAEDMVETWLKLYQLEPIRYSKTEMRRGLKTPDFRVLHCGVEKFLCEVKAVLPAQSGYEGSDSIPNRLTADIHDAYKKFTASNLDHRIPNVLAFVQRDFAAGVDYLEDVLLGKWFLDSGDAAHFYTKYAEGRIKDEKGFVDLYLWFDDDKAYFRFTGSDPEHFAELCRTFGLKSAGIPKIGV